MTPYHTNIKSTIDQLLPEALRFLEDLVRSNSYTHNPKGIKKNALRIARQFVPMGFTPRKVSCAEPGTGEHLILDSGGKGPVIACISHLDTVFALEEEARNQFHWMQEGNRLFGPGSYDIKGGTAALWMLMRTFASHEQEVFRSIRWILIWNAAEEILAEDFGQLCLGLLPPSTRACLVFEGDSRNNEDFCIVRSRKGSGHFRVRVSGRGAHAGSQYGTGANAIHQMARVIDKIMALTDLSKETTVNVGRVQGGSVVNRVPHEAEAFLEVRAYDSGCYETVRDAILALTGPGEISAHADNFSCRIEVTLLKEILPWPLNPGTESLVSHWQEAATDCGYRLDVSKRGGLSDGNWLWKHFPTLDGLGPRGGNSHTSERALDRSKLPEYVDVSSFVPKTLLNYLAIRALLDSKCGV